MEGSIKVAKGLETIVNLDLAQSTITNDKMKVNTLKNDKGRNPTPIMIQNIGTTKISLDGNSAVRKMKIDGQIKTAKVENSAIIKKLRAKVNKKKRAEANREARNK